MDIDPKFEALLRAADKLADKVVVTRDAYILGHEYGVDRAMKEEAEAVKNYLAEKEKLK